MTDVFTCPLELIFRVSHRYENRIKILKFVCLCVSSLTSRNFLFSRLFFADEYTTFLAVRYREGQHILPSRFTSLLLRVAKNVSDEIERISRGAHFDNTSFLVGGVNVFLNRIIYFLLHH